MQSNILSAAAIGLCLAAIAPLSAQVSEPQEEPSAPRVLMVIREQIKEGREAARIASLNALAAARQHLGNLARLRKLVKLTVLLATTEEFADHAGVADGASDLFVQVFGREVGHTRLVYGVYSLPLGAPVIVDTIFAIAPLSPA